jgi:hypothetical protein
VLKKKQKEDEGKGLNKKIHLTGGIATNDTRQRQEKQTYR